MIEYPKNTHKTKPIEKLHFFSQIISAQILDSSWTKNKNYTKMKGREQNTVAYPRAEDLLQAVWN